MKGKLNLEIFLSDNSVERIEGLELGQEKYITKGVVSITLSGGKAQKIVVQTLKEQTVINKVSYEFIIEMRNYSKVIAPDSGRWFMNSTSIIGFWRNFRKLKTTIADIKFPAFIFLKNNKCLGETVGVIGKNHETLYEVLEPESNRALNVHTGNIRLKIEKGNNIYPLNVCIYKDIIYYDNYEQSPNKSWMMVMRDIAEIQRVEYAIKENFLQEALEPMWCSWVDWDSKDITEGMLLDNMKAGVKLAIKNFIIDDGWYGNGLDSNYSVDMNIGDWLPDEKKIPDMKRLVIKAKEMGARPIIWCAPHAVAKKSIAYKKNKDYLIADETGNPILNEPQYYSYCFQCNEGRKIMEEICLQLLEKWDFSGAKYDLFNWIPDCKCQNPNHKHDLPSMLQGLEETLRNVEERTRKIKKNYIVELKQNYGTVFNTQYGNLMRAGDSPFDMETNYLRTLHIQAYTPYALNDYQTFTKDDTPEDVASMIIKMMAAGVPAYGVNFMKISDKVKQVIKYHNEWYLDHISMLKKYRVPYDVDNKIMCIHDDNINIYFAVEHGVALNIEKEAVIFNGTYDESVLISNGCTVELTCICYDCYGNIKNKTIVPIERTFYSIVVPIGGHSEFYKNV